MRTAQSTTPTMDAYLTYEEWLLKYYGKRPEDLTEDEDDMYWDAYHTATTVDLM